MRIGFTATREGMTALQKLALEWLLNDRRGEFHHGDCVGGDSEGHDIAKAAKLRINVHPPTNDRMRAFREGDVMWEPAPYLERNQMIGRACDVLVAAPATETEELRSGTWSTVRFVRTLDKPIMIIMPNGTIKVELHSIEYEMRPLEAKKEAVPV